MRRLSLLLLLAVAGTAAFAQKEETIVSGKKTTFFSHILNENRTLWVYTPDQTALVQDNNKRYPVVFVLDGEAHFLSTVGIIQQLSQANGNSVLPEMIVVGIENTNRLRDLSPASVTADGKTGINPFVTFLKSELIPYVDSHYHTAPYKILVGHSLGGLTAIDILISNPNLFNAYIAIDPSMWYNNEQVLQNTLSGIAAEPLKNTRLFIGTANTLPEGIKLADLKKDSSAGTQHIRSVFKLDKFLKGHPNPGLQYASRYYESESHLSVPLPCEYDGLRFIFNYYGIGITEKDLTDSTSAIAAKYKEHYAKISAELGYKNAPPLAFINYLGQSALQKKQYTRAASLFQLNREYYPDSNTVYDSFGDYFLAKNDTQNAVLNFQKALALKKDMLIENKLSALSHREKFTLSDTELEKYAGVYLLEAYKIDITLAIRDGQLLATVPGQEADVLIPVSKDVFTVKNKQGYSVTFQMNESRAVAFTSVQPNGVFKAVWKN